MANKKNMKYSKQEMEAMKVQALLAGLDPSTIQNEEVELDNKIDEAYEEACKEAVSKKKKNSTSKKKEEAPIIKERVIEMRPEFERLRKDLTMNVIFNQHDIHYKEQFWPIPVVDRTYNVELVKIPKQARDIAEMLSKADTREMERAYKGLVRYFKLVCYGTVPYRARELGYIRVSVKDGKLISQAFPLLKVAAANNISVEKLKKDINKKAIEVIS